MTQRVDIPASDLDHLLRRLARQRDDTQATRPGSTLCILTMTEWSARIVSICVAALTGVVITLSLASRAETVAHATPAAVTAPNRSAKSDSLRGTFDVRFKDTIQTVRRAALDPAARLHFAFIRGGLDDRTLTWMPAKKPTARLGRHAERKSRPTRKPHARPATRTAATPSKRQPWLLDLLIRHMARGS